MEPFKVATSLAKLTGHYPDAQSVLEVAQSGGAQARVALARLWLSEGIPYAFKDCPGVYESIRTWLSSLIAVDAKSISITGSARLGSSLSPAKVNRKFDEHSDLDIFIVSKDLFENMRTDFQSWSADFERGILQPKNDREGRFWRDNNNRGVALIQRGFLDSKMIPNREKYEVTQRINQTMWLLIEKLKITANAPNAAKASVRCYNSWDAYVRQTVLSLSQQDI